MLGRPRQFNEDDALDKAMACFWRGGYRGTSLHTLTGATGLSKSSLYAALGDKDRVFSRCLARYRRLMVDQLEARLAAADNARAFVAGVLETLAIEAGEADPRGCLAMNSATEIGRDGAELSDSVQACIAAFEQVFRRAVRQGQAEGSIAAGHDAADLARFLVAHIGGVRNMIKAGTVHSEQVRRVNAIALTALA